MSEKIKLSALLDFSESGNLRSVSLVASTDDGAATLEHALGRVLKSEAEEIQEIAIRLKWLIAIIEKAALECRLARLEA